MISNLASISPKAQIGNNVTIEPFTVIYEDVVIGDNCHIGPNVTIMSGTRMGKNNKVFPGAVIGAIPQDLKYKGENSLVEIGDNNTIRECVTINRGTVDRMTTKMGNNNLLMAYTHLGHDTILGNNIIIANNGALAGHITINDFAIIEGVVAAQQFVNVGAHSFIAGGSLIRKSVPPYVRVAREPLQFIGVNIVGLTRRGFDKEIIKQIEDIYRIIFVRGHTLSQAIEIVEQDIPDSPQKREIVEFIRVQKDGIVKGI
ncbi:MAG: acyl-ACP--UDP-N-acetylglucosamine O-acyltransferase [Bacteroidetes bacterium]|nr:acyl-ACP--UDP-N-acetylglucosamine O-acyltransferase [Bacteroidota bacterium]